MKNHEGETLALDLLTKDKTIVILCHGYGAHKGSRWIKKLADSLPCSSLRFDYSGCGHSEGSFEEATFSKKVSDLHDVIDFCKDFDKIILLGHSMSGAVVLNVASERDDISAVIDLAGLVHVHKFSERLNKEQQKELKTTGKTTYFKPDGTKYPMTKAFVDDTLSWKLFDSVKLLKRPLLIIHGEHDTSVPLQESKDLVALVSCPVTLTTISADHYYKKEEEREALTKTIIDWLKHENFII